MDLSPASALTSARKDIRSLVVLLSPPKPYDDRHKYEPNKRYPWFCKHCGYAEHEKLKHF